MIIILRKLNVWFSVVRTKLVKIEIALLIWKIYYSIKLDFSKIQFLHELYVCMHDIRQKTKEGNIKNMSIFHDWTSHKKPCDHQWSYSSVSTKRYISWTIGSQYNNVKNSTEKHKMLITLFTFMDVAFCHVPG